MLGDYGLLRITRFSELPLTVTVTDSVNRIAAPGML